MTNTCKARLHVRVSFNALPLVLLFEVGSGFTQSFAPSFVKFTAIRSANRTSVVDHIHGFKPSSESAAGSDSEVKRRWEGPLSHMVRIDAQAASM